MSKKLLVDRCGDEIYAFVNDQSITAAHFIADILDCAESLPDCQYSINLCRDRYSFSVAFFAAIVRKQTNLLPSKRDVSDAVALKERYEDVVIISDEDVAEADHKIKLNPGKHGRAESPIVASEHTAAIAFTSGSTGVPEPHSKTWCMLHEWRQVHRRYLPGDTDTLRGMVATVPSWHMYGLEWALLLPTAAPIALYCGSDFFPSDVVAALSKFSVETILVSTPVHLRALCKVPAPEKPIQVVLSATAPLDDVLASKVEEHLRTSLFEIYGCSEVGSLAWRYPLHKPHWRFFDCFEVNFEGKEISISHSELQTTVTLADCFRQAAPGEFELLGRASDIVKVAGKRESLANLNATLMNIEGVEDGIFYQPMALDLPDTGRLGLLAVAPTLSTQEIRSQLADRLDAVFLPRPIRLVADLPRDKTSKLSKDAIRRLVLDSDD